MCIPYPHSSPASTMSTNAAKLEFPGHFSSPSHSPPFIPVGEARRLSELDAMSDVHLPGAYPASPKKSSVGGNNDVLSKPPEETTRQLSDAEEYANRATQSPTVSSERFQEEKNNRDFSQEHDRGDLVAMENLSMNDRPDSFQEGARAISDLLDDVDSEWTPIRIFLSKNRPTTHLRHRIRIYHPESTFSRSPRHLNYRLAPHFAPVSGRRIKEGAARALKTSHWPIAKRTLSKTSTLYWNMRN